MQKES